MSKIFVAFRAGKDYGVTRSVLPPFYEGFLTALQACGHELAVIPHNISALEWGGGYRMTLETVSNDSTPTSA